MSFVAILADFILNHFPIMPGIPCACAKHFVLPEASVTRFFGELEKKIKVWI